MIIFPLYNLNTKGYYMGELCQISMWTMCKMLERKPSKCKEIFLKTLSC